MNSLPLNPFTRPTFWGRHNEIHMISRYLLSTPPQCCALIGETSFGKTRLLRHLAYSQDPAFLAEWPGETPPPFVYLDCISYVGSARLGDQASARFWWDLYSATQARLQGSQSPGATWTSLDQAPLDRAFELKTALEDLIREQPRPVVFLLDNFEGIARLPLRDSEWLRSLVQYPCAYVVASRHLLYLLYQYHAENWASPSPLWNIFSGPLYLGLMAEEEVHSFLLQASHLANQAGSHWEASDLTLLRQMAGRHPDLLRIACARLFELRLRGNQSFDINASELIVHDARSTCQLLWHGLADPEFWDTPQSDISEENEVAPPTPYQQVLLDLAREHEVTDTTLLYVLEQRGLIERVGGSWCVFSEAMRRFILEQGLPTPDSERALISPSPPRNVSTERHELVPFTYLEDKVYAYLKAHAGHVCEREEIKQAVWEHEQDRPGNSALQKIIERIREKIEPEPANPRYLIAVRGQGYMLRNDAAEPTDNGMN